MAKNVSAQLLARFAKKPDFHQSPMYANVMRKIGWQIEGKPGEQIFVRTLGPIAVAKMQRPVRSYKNAISNVRKKYRTITFQLEPSLSTHWKSTTPKLGFSKQTLPLAHSASALLDLTLSEQQLLSNMKQKTRYNIHLAERKKIVHIREVSLSQFSEHDFRAFMNMRAAWSKRKNVYGYDEQFLTAVIESFKDHGFCLFAEINGVTEAILLVLEWKKTAIYFCAFSSIKGYQHFAPTLLTWRAMQIAQSHNNDIFDFGGTYDPRFTGTYKRWKGFTTFKEGFSPVFFLYPPSFLKLGWW